MRDLRKCPSVFTLWHLASGILQSVEISVDMVFQFCSNFQTSFEVFFKNTIEKVGAPPSLPFSAIFLNVRNFEYLYPKIGLLSWALKVCASSQNVRICRRIRKASGRGFGWSSVLDDRLSLMMKAIKAVLDDGLYFVLWWKWKLEDNWIFTRDASIDAINFRYCQTVRLINSFGWQRCPSRMCDSTSFKLCVKTKPRNWWWIKAVSANKDFFCSFWDFFTFPCLIFLQKSFSHSNIYCANNFFVDSWVLWGVYTGVRGCQRSQPRNTEFS